MAWLSWLLASLIRTWCEPVWSSVILVAEFRSQNSAGLFCLVYLASNLDLEMKPIEPRDRVYFPKV